jgi:hypothetical protein
MGRQSKIGLYKLLSVHAIAAYSGKQAFEVSGLKHGRRQRGSAEEVPSDSERHAVQHEYEDLL